jgi:hypothetical protein
MIHLSLNFEGTTPLTVDVKGYLHATNMMREALLCAQVFFSHRLKDGPQRTSATAVDSSGTIVSTPITRGVEVNGFQQEELRECG